jgi:hypothetical protein
MNDATDDFPIGNFVVGDIQEVDVITESGTIPSVRFVIQLDSGPKIEKTLPIEGLEKLNLYNLHPHLTLLHKLPTAQKKFVTFIRTALPDAPEKVTQNKISRLGTHIIRDEPMYHTGRVLIRAGPPPDPGDRPDIVAESSEYKIDIDPTLSETEAIAEMVNAVSLSPDVGRVVLAHSLLSMMREVYKAAWRPPRCSLFIFTESGQLKTMYTSYLSQLHNRAEGIAEPTRLDATTAAAEAIIFEKSDCAVILDDLFPSKHRDKKDQQEKTLVDILRIIGDGVGRAKMDGKQISKGTPTVGVIFTGEYLIVSASSDAARMLPVQSSVPIDDAKLRECLSRPLALSTFYHFFITWYIENYADIKSLLEEWWDKYTRKDMGIHRRLKETHFFLNSAFKLFLRYCAEKTAMPYENEIRHARSFEDLVTKLVREQAARVKQLATPGTDEKADIFKLVCKWHQEKFFKLLKERDVKPLDELGKRLKGYDGFKYNGLLCLEPDRLLKMVQTVIPTATVADVSRALRAKGALKLDGANKNYKVGNRRYYGIYPSKLSTE